MEAEGGDRAAAGKRRGRAPARQLQPLLRGFPSFSQRPPSRLSPRAARLLCWQPPRSLRLPRALARCSPARRGRGARRRRPSRRAPRCPQPRAASSRRCGTAGSPSSPQRPPWRCEEAAKTRPKSRAFPGKLCSVA